ncbi:MAG TPA: hypothetical protein VFW54_02865, partial [Propionibacteriaceae bacterium]|nr:hypothetical protein [Propionibacteriaceae bacterium]
LHIVRTLATIAVATQATQKICTQVFSCMPPSSTVDYLQDCAVQMAGLQPKVPSIPAKDHLLLVRLISRRPLERLSREVAALAMAIAATTNHIAAGMRSH